MVILKTSALLRGVFLGAALLLLAAGCASIVTQSKQYKNSDAFLANRDYEAALKQIEAAQGKEYKKKDAVLFYLDAGVLAHYAGRYELSNQYLSSAEKAIVENQAVHVGNAIASGVLNDNALNYGGEDYEDVYLNYIKALNYLALGDEEGALVEAKRAEFKISNLERKYGKEALSSGNDEHDRAIAADKTYQSIKKDAAKVRFFGSVATLMLNAVIFQNQGLYDDARINRQKILTAYAGYKTLYPFPPPEPMLDAIRSNSTGVFVVGLSGRTPVKVAKDIRFVVPMFGRMNYVKFSIPIMKAKEDVTAVMKVATREAGIDALPVESVSLMAANAYLAKLPGVFVRDVVRGIAKSAAVSASAAAVNNSVHGTTGGWASLATMLGGHVLADLSARADLRISRFFPSMIWSGFRPLAPGDHEIIATFYDKKGAVLNQERRVVTVLPGRILTVEFDSLR